MAETRQPEYLHTVCEPSQVDGKANHMIDIVFVHGLNPRSKPDFGKQTWTHPNQNFWPTDQLAQAIPTARILIFSYNSQVAWDVSSNGIQQHAENLLDRLTGAREITHSKQSFKPPIIFVAHSMGGLVVKQALVTAKANDTYRDIKAYTYGLMFFAVPHRGGHGATLGVIAKGLVTAVTGETRNDLVESLKSNSMFQESQSAMFRHQLEDFRIVSVVETRKTKATKIFGLFTNFIVVDEQSATLGLSGGREKILRVDASHSEVCRFSGDNDQFDPIKRALVTLATDGAQAQELLAAAIVENQGRAAEQKMLESIKQKLGSTIPDMAVVLQQICKRTCPGTATWLEQNTTYQTWLRAGQGRFWILAEVQLRSKALGALKKANH